VIEEAIAAIILSLKRHPGDPSVVRRAASAIARYDSATARCNSTLQQHTETVHCNSILQQHAATAHCSSTLQQDADR